MWHIVISITSISLISPLLGYFFLSHLILFKSHLSTFKYTHLIIFKTQEYLCLPILKSPWFKSMAKQISLMEFKSIIEAHDSNPWRFIQNPILIGNIKAQFSLATSNLNSHWHYFIKKKRAQDYQRLAKKKYHSTVARKDHGNHLMKKLIESYLEDYVLILWTHEIYGHHFASQHP